MICLLMLLFATYKVQTPAGIIDMAPENYVAGVVAGESSIFRSDEALKAMAIAARSYAAHLRGRHASEGYDFCSTTHCQRYVTPSARSSQAARDTAGQMLWFNGKPAFSVYSRSCGGRTENVNAVWPDVAVPYLISHPDPYCHREWVWSGTGERIRTAVLQAGLKVPASLNSINIVRRSESGRAQMLSLGGELLSASSFRFAVGRYIGWNAVRSEQYSIETAGERIIFRGSGEGHGVGLCQMGADAMGLSGKSDREILAFYYPGATLHAQDIQWTRLSGEGVVLYSIRPDGDRAVIGMAERMIRTMHGRFPWRFPVSVEIFAYPDLESFRNATGEPGWVAARTSGARIDLQPTAILRSHNALESTLEHELVHCVVESAARPGLPVWFREGLVEYLAGHPLTGTQPAPDDDLLRQRHDRQAAADAYLAAQVRVTNLIARYGEATVLGWVSGGLPEDVKNSSASKPKVNNR